MEIQKLRENKFSKPVRILLLCILSSLLIICCSLFWPRFLYQKGITHLKLKNYEQAAAYFNKAEQAIPGLIGSWFAGADLFRIYTNYGQVFYHLGEKQWKKQGVSGTSYDLLVTAKLYFVKAAEIEPDHYINMYWLTRTEEGLEKAYAWLNPKKKNPYDAYAFYQKALPLRPSGITIRYAYTKYLQYRGFDAKIPALVQYMVAIYPASYHWLKKETFFNNDLIPYILQGLDLSLENQILRRDALRAFSDIYFSTNDFENAISYYQNYLNYKPVLNSSYDYIRLGSLYLKAGQYNKCFDFFKKGLLSATYTNSTTNYIYRIFKREKRFEEFIKFSFYLHENNLDTRSLNICVAKAWIEMDRPQLAKARLIKMNAVHPYPPAYDLLARIAYKEKNWDQMELMAQKAIRLDPSNAIYYYLFSKALSYQNKYAHAEEAVTSAIQHSPKESAGFFSYRGWIRWRQKKYTKAAADWQKAFSIKPDQSQFPYYISMALEREGRFMEGLDFIQKAIFLDPDNKKYKDLQKRLKAYQ